MKLIVIAKPDCAYVTTEGSYHYASREIETLLFDGEPAKRTHKSGWWRVKRVPEIVERIEKERSFVAGYKLRDGLVQSDLLPATVPADHFDESDDGDSPNGIYRALYDEIVEHLPNRVVPVECEIAVIAERSADWELVEDWTGVKHRIVDQIETHPALLQDKQCELSGEDSYKIIREHVKKHIDSKVAKISSDYDFCFDVKKIVETEPTAYERCLNPNARKLKFVTDYRTHRDVTVLSIAPKQYNKYDVVEPFRGENYVDLKYNIDKYLSELMENINSAAKDCPHCKGYGVVFDGHF